MNQEKIGKFISKCRKNKNLTQQELAEKLGVSDRTVGNWENGRNMPDLWPSKVSANPKTLPSPSSGNPDCLDGLRKKNPLK